MSKSIALFAGPSASGKTTLVDTTLQLLNLGHRELTGQDQDIATMLRQDWYYAVLKHAFNDAQKKALELGLEITAAQACALDIDYEPGMRLNYDSPRMTQWSHLGRDIGRWLMGTDIERAQYDFSIHDYNSTLEPNTISGACPILLVEGLHVLSHDYSEFHLLDDIKERVYQDTPLAVCRERRIARDPKERGRTVGECTAQYDQAVAPEAREHILPTKANATRVIEYVSGLSSEDCWQQVIDDAQKIAQELYHHATRSELPLIKLEMPERFRGYSEAA